MDKVEILKCTDCGASFVFTEREQSFYRMQGWNKPIRCQECRSRKKVAWKMTEDKYEGLFEVMRNSHIMKRDTKGRVINRSASSWIHIDPEFLQPVEY